MCIAYNTPFLQRKPIANHPDMVVPIIPCVGSGILRPCKVVSEFQHVVLKLNVSFKCEVFGSACTVQLWEDTAQAISRSANANRSLSFPKPCHLRISISAAGRGIFPGQLPGVYTAEDIAAPYRNFQICERALEGSIAAHGKSYGEVLPGSADAGSMGGPYRRALC